MAFDALTRQTLRRCTVHDAVNHPHTEDKWYGPWADILNHLFPSSQGYEITPQFHVTDPDNSTYVVPNFVIRAGRIDGDVNLEESLASRTVLLVEIKSSSRSNDHGKEALMRQIEHQADSAFSDGARRKLFWIGVIGPHWLFGEKREDGQELTPLIRWHDVTHDDTSYHDFTRLAMAVRRLLP
jgi:hypothetical protein